MNGPDIAPPTMSSDVRGLEGTGLEEEQLKQLQPRYVNILYPDSSSMLLHDSRYDVLLMKAYTPATSRSHADGVVSYRPRLHMLMYQMLCHNAHPHHCHRCETFQEHSREIRHG